MTSDRPLTKNELPHLAKSVLLEGTTALITSNEEMENIMKIVKPLEESGLLMRGISETTENEAKEQKCEFIEILLETLTANILGNALAGKGVIRAGKGVIRAGQKF